MKKVDIVIPVYNAYEDLTVCIDSLKRNTDLKEHRVILINDCSPDERIRPYLENLEKDGFLVIHNEENRGFSNNVNKGFSMSQDRDVLLLNTDTILTKCWLEKLIRCAYSDPSIGTVTPLSNNATLCSVPEFCEENVLPKGCALEEFAELIERCSLRRYPRITVAVGFCMYIKREVISLIGGFDAETFERGYGEENDFCFRAEQAGYYHAMCDNAYVYHTGTKSFVSKEKQKLINAHEAVLNQRYPVQMQRNREFVRDNPNSFVQDNLKIYLPFQNKKKNILFLLQSDFREEASDHTGGVQLHVKDLTMELRRDYNVFVVARDRKELCCTGYTEEDVVRMQFYIGDMPDYPVFYSKKFLKLYESILDAFSIDLVHVHHTIGLSLDIYPAAKKRNIPVVATVHDYYWICPSEKLLDSTEKVCSFDSSREACKQCLRARFGIADTVDYQQIWRREHEKALLESVRIVVPSGHAGGILTKYYPETASRVCVIEHGSDILPLRQNSRQSHEGFRIAFIGGINESKGSRIIYELVKDSSLDVEWYLFGGIGDRELAYLEKNNFHKMGPYVREELPGLLQSHGIDLICIFSVWPETFCYTLSEAVASRIPVLVSGTGALGERTEQMECGWAVPDFCNVDSITEQIRVLQSKPQEYQACADRVKEIALRSIGEMAQCYRELYQECMKEKETKHECYDAEQIYQGYKMASGTCASVGELPEHVLARLQEAENSLYIIYHSPSYKLVNKLKSLPIPGKKRLKAIFYKIYKKMG